MLALIVPGMAIYRKLLANKEDDTIHLAGADALSTLAPGGLEASQSTALFRFILCDIRWIPRGSLVRASEREKSSNNEVSYRLVIPISVPIE